MEVITTTPTLELAPVQPGEPRMKQLVSWDEYREQAEKLKTTAETLTVTNVSQVAEMKLARVTRLTIKNLRVAITKRHTELKSGILEEGRKIDAGKNELLKILEPLEERLLLQETFAEREQTRILEEKRTTRLTELTPFLLSPPVIDIALLTDENYAALLRDSIAVHNARIERERAEQAAAEAARKAEAERIEAQRIENERLKKEAAERAAELQAAAIERDRLAKQIEDERKIAQIKVDEEAARVRTEKLAVAAKAEAQARKDREAAEAVLRAEREARAKVEAEIAARKAAEAQAEAAAKQAAEAAALAPDKEKIMAYTAALMNVPIPAMSNPKSEKLIADIRLNLHRFIGYIQSEANNL